MCGSTSVCQCAPVSRLIDDPSILGGLFPVETGAGRVSGSVLRAMFYLTFLSLHFVSIAGPKLLTGMIWF